MSKPAGKLLFALTIILFMVYSSASVLTMAQGEDINISVEYTFGEKIEFSGKLADDKQIDGIVLFIKVKGENKTRSEVPNLTEGSDFELSYDLKEQPIRAYSEITYWLEVTLKNGEVLKRNQEDIRLLLDRIKTLEDKPGMEAYQEMFSGILEELGQAKPGHKGEK